MENTMERKPRTVAQLYEALTAEIDTMLAVALRRVTTESLREDMAFGADIARKAVGNVMHDEANRVFIEDMRRECAVVLGQGDYQRGYLSNGVHQ